MKIKLMSSNRNIIMVGNTAWGMYNFRKDLLKTLLTNGYSITVIAPFDLHFTSKIKDIGCDFINIEIDAKGSNIISDLKLIIHFLKIYKKLKPSFIFHYTIKPNIYGSIAAKILNIPHIAVITGLGYTFLNRNFVSFFAKLLYKISLTSAKQIWFLNQDDKNLFISKKILKADRCRILNGEGINLEEYHPQEKENNIKSFLLIARLLWDKGVREYVEAARLLKKANLNVQFNIIGYTGVNNPSAVEEKDVTAWQNEGTINYLGSTNNIISYIANSSCIVLPSYREGLSRVLLEAASMSRPIVATNITGCKEIVDDGISGYLCEVKNAQSLADKMQIIISLSEEQLNIMGSKGREKVTREFDQKIINNEYLKILNVYLS